MISSADESLFHKWERERTPVLVILSVARLASVRFKGSLTEFRWPKVRFEEGVFNLQVDLSTAQLFERLGIEKVRPEDRPFLEDFSLILRVVLEDAELFIVELVPITKN
jgi:hypothetical protein